MGLETNTTYLARTDELVVRELGDELLVYDEREDVAHCLSSTAASVWQACEGGASFEDLVARVDLDGEAEGGEGRIAAALEELSAKQLLQGPSLVSGITRRHALRRMAGVGAAAVATPLIVSATVKTPYASAACLQQYSVCTADSQCCTYLGLICTSGGASGSHATKYCNTSTCTPNGSKPGGNSCTSANQGLCCSGTCSGSNCA